ncbi:MAG: PAAR domain-containing protein [Deltaproteobacteria bacterium]|nr:PAAR domain-containing protein [Nannocystaceae bacterium]
MVPGDAVEYEQVATQFSAPAPYVARVSDPTAHGMPLGPGIGSTDVLIAGLPAFRALVDFCVCAAATPIPHVGGVAPVGDPTVMINGFPIVRAGDVIVEPCGGPNPVLMGCTSVMAGAAPPPVDIVKLVPHERDDTIEIGDFIELRLSGPVTGELGYAEVGAKLGAKANLESHDAQGRMKGEALLGLGRVSGSGELVVHLPFVDKIFRVNGTGSAVLGCASGEVDVGVVEEGGKMKPKLSVVPPVAKPFCTDNNFDVGFEDEDPSED